MRRLVAGSIIAGFAVLSSFTLVGGQSDPVSPPVQVRTTPGSLSNMIDEVDVPWEILEYIQMKYEGHAVTKADRVTRGTSELYRLRVDRDDIATDYESIAVLFDMKWRLIGEEKYATPPPPPPQPSIVKPQEKPKEVEDKKKPEKPAEAPVETEPAEGGLGAGTEPVIEDGGTPAEETTETPNETTQTEQTPPQA